jgi:23S rRNA (uracil1939-C5)-methyltransferase
MDARGAARGNSVSAVDVAIESIAAGGDGVGRSSGVVVFVPRTAPGDTARVELDVRKRFARGRLEQLLVASGQRVQPLCYHYRVDKCGGCQLQHMSYESQLAAKQGIIRDSLTRIGKRPVDRPEIQPSEKQWRYRQKLTLAMRRGRDGQWVIGLHPYDDSVGVFQLSDCPITDERVMNVWREVMEARRFFPPADELRASVQLLTDNEASIVMEGGDRWPGQSAFFETVPSATALWWKAENRARLLVAQRGRNAATASFAQVNVDMGHALHEYVLERARTYRPSVVVDAYAGSGATAIPLAADGVRVTAIEADRDASARCAALLPEGSRAVAARVEDAIDDALPADVVLINPPRTGVHEHVSTALQGVATPPRALIYVSCDPGTLARDLSRMPRYRIASLRAFDMFPQTAHVETVCELVPEAA